MASPQDGTAKQPRHAEPPKGSAAVRHRLVTWLPSVCCLVAAALIGLTVILPVWALDLYAPQYPEGPITLYAYAYKLEEQYEDVRGEIFELKILNNLLGGRFPEQPVELSILPFVLGMVALLSVSAACIPGRRALLLKAALLLALLTMLAGSAGLQWRLYTFGHHRDPGAALREIPAFTVPLVGASSFANWKTVSRFEIGAYMFGLATGLLGLAFWFERRSRRVP
ncbi:MAG TPA: hypothetical protein VNP04_16150 [Alphaproteobacteria bacterium]|nr:hypothetical protein [Alphaproteobacteria bacterium]